MGARPVKNSVWYELSIAAYLGLFPIRVGSWELNLTDATIDPNRRSYPSEKTKAGYPNEIDITITKLNEQFNISCKFTEYTDAILKANSPDFLKALLEFMPLYGIENQFVNINMNYFLVTSFRLGQDLTNKSNLTASEYRKISESAIKLAKADYGNVNENLFRPNDIKNFVAKLQIKSVNATELENLYETNEEFKKRFDAMPRSLLNIPRQGLSLNQFVDADLTLFCKSKNHKNCYDCIAENKYCHIGHADKISQNLNTILKRKSSILMAISFNDLGIDINQRQTRNSLAPEAVTHIIGSILNDKRIIAIEPPYAFYVLPVTFEIIAFNPRELAKKIHSTEDENNRVHPAKVAELKDLNLGPKAFQELTKLAYLKGFGYGMPESDIIIDIDY